MQIDNLLSAWSCGMLIKFFYYHFKVDSEWSNFASFKIELSQ